MRIFNIAVAIFYLISFSYLANGYSSALSPIKSIFENVAEFGRKFLRNAQFLHPGSKNDPAARMTTPEMIRYEGYPVEVHEVMTYDRYLLTLHRIPGRPGSRAVFLQHGLLGSSYDWVLTGKYRGLAFILADLGYDVWLGNSRGNTYSKKHLYLPTNSLQYWTFSWHEMGIYDLPAAISYVSNIKQNDSLIYIGHSQGATQFFVLATEYPYFAAEKIRASFVMGVGVFMSNMRSPLRVFKNKWFRNSVELFFRSWSNREVLPQSPIVKFLSYGCEIDAVHRDICANLLFVIGGFDKPQFNLTLLPRVLHDYPSGSSVLTLIHYGQEGKTGRFQKFDYGTSENIKKYNQRTPPDYDLSKIRVPIGLFWAENDLLSDPRDALKLASVLPTLILNYRINYLKFNHLDYLWAIDAPKLVYNQLINVMEYYRE